MGCGHWKRYIVTTVKLVGRNDENYTGCGLRYARKSARCLRIVCANTDPQRGRLFTKYPSDVLEHATSEIASGSKRGIEETPR
jgi:hypothetical protein